MNSKEKMQLTLINKKIPIFKECIKKLTLGEELNNREKTYILSVAIFLIKNYEADKRHTSYIEFAYYIILRYATKYQDYRPLNDFAINFGFYPIAKDIQSKGLIPNVKLTDEIANIQLDNFINGNYVETFEQQNTRLNLLKDDSSNISYVAPTSFGKSSLVIEHIKKYLGVNNRIGIIVPTKSLLMQTYKEVRKANLGGRIIIHDEMYRDDKRFIGVLTQERALRLLEKNKISFDILYIDEAHNLFEKESRSILLSRLIRYNLKRNNNQKVVYLSPLINDSNNLKMDSQQEIVEQKIQYNMKEPVIFEYREDRNIFLYNRFTNEFYPNGQIEDSGNESGYITYIKKRMGNKNFIYHRSPRRIEEFSKELYSSLVFIDNQSSINHIIKELEEFVHKDFYIIELLKKGIIYLHGRMPEIIKEYLEYHFKNNPELKIVIANKVILEGINLPIDTLFIMHTNYLKEKELTNLIGRVNRLNQIFGVESNQLSKLLPPVHFINSRYNKKAIKMQNLIKKLRSNIFSDEIKNPTLAEFDFNSIKDENKINKVEEIRKNENLILSEPQDELEKVKRVFVKSGLEEMIYLNKTYLTEIINRISKVRSSKKWENYDIIDKVYYFFIDKFDRTTIFDFEVYRLINEKARNFYRMHIILKQKNSLKDNIVNTFTYFKQRIKQGNGDMYIGSSYGEKAISTSSYPESLNKLFVDLRTKTNAELINLAIIKLKLEDDFIGYRLNKLIIALFDLGLITEEEYNDFVYGTNNKKTIDLLKTGLTLGLISKLQKDKQLININFDEYNNLVVNVDFLEYKNSLNGFYRFEIEKFL
ncbi:DEAD/DEAH box helicase [Peribacillus sp. NPDC097895]|uniref:DEAD/DEAH box helicase n=1 Tax=Peribacillus sp. NPDC097895 TaxID=3390619 RepID=UPI003D075F15